MTLRFPELPYGRHSDNWTAIVKAKVAAWKELMTTLERDLWGRLYRVVMQHIRPRSLAVTEKMEIPVVTRVVEGLFPEYMGAEAPRILNRPDMADTDLISIDEMKAVAREIKKLNSAPGPDGISVRVLLSLLMAASNRLKDCLNACMLQGCFPRS